MFHEKRLLNLVRNQGVGPGGWNCQCCAPRPSARKAWIRKVKRGKFKVLIKKMIEEGLNDKKDTKS